VGFFCLEVEPFPWVEHELLFFCLECKEPFPDLLSDLEEFNFCLVLFPEVPEARVHRILHMSFPVSSINSLDKFPEAERVFGFSWWTMSSLIVWQVHCKPACGVLPCPTEHVRLAAEN